MMVRITGDVSVSWNALIPALQDHIVKTEAGCFSEYDIALLRSLADSLESKLQENDRHDRQR